MVGLFCWNSISHPLPAQELREHPTPFSVWLDFKAFTKTNAPKIGLPMWLESVRIDRRLTTDGTPSETLYRLRLRRLGDLNREIAVRLFFDDKPGASPVVTGWTETGVLRYQSEPLGSSLELPTSASLLVPVDGVDYIDITTPGGGDNVRGAFVATVRKAEIKAGFDFPLPSDAADPFGNLPAAVPQTDDSYLFGRVRATLEAGPLKLTNAPDGQEAPIEFSLDKQPLVALITFEVLNGDLTFPPEITINAKPLGTASLHLPDLADVGYRGEVRPLQNGMRFRYNGWLRCQKLIPGTLLHSGLNQLIIRVNNQAGSVAVRTVEIQLKHEWQNSDYTLHP